MAAEDLALVATRPYRDGDKNFILASWLRGLYYGSEWFREIPKEIFMENYHKVIDHILNRAQVTVACLKDDEDVILAYSVHGAHKLHWVFCKKAWRGIGISKLLVPVETTTITHLTKVAISYLRKNPNVHFNPFSL